MRSRRPIDLSADHPISPFPFVVRQMTLLGHLVAYWNTSSKNVVMKKAAQEARSKIIDLYSSLPVDLLWSSTKYVEAASSLCELRAELSVCAGRPQSLRD